MAFQKAATLEDVWPGEMLGLSIGGTRVLLVNVEGEVHAFEDRCAHMGARISEGRFEGQALTCGAHQWQYDARTGEGLNPKTAMLRRFPVAIEGEVILVDVDEPDAAKRARPERGVGPVLEVGPVGDAVVAAIRDLNAGVVTLDRGGYVRVEVPRRCAVTRVAVERHLGRPFHLPGDLERVMPSFEGRFAVSEAEASWAIEAEGQESSSWP